MHELGIVFHIIRMVEAAQSSKPPVQRIVDRAALLFVPTVALISLVTFLSWWILGGTALLPHAILSAVAVLVIACPCAMGLATPTALMVSIGKAAQQQILVKDATALELLRKVDALVTDKTGTLTHATPTVVQVVPFGTRTEEALRGYQRRTSLTVDGVCGCSSWKKITTAVIGIGRTKTTID